MYNHNNNVWPAMAPMTRMVASMAYPYGTQALNQTAITANVLSQNANYLSPYYHQNQAYGQHYPKDYNFYGTANPYGQTLANPSIAPHLPQPYQSVATNSYVRPQNPSKPIVTTNRTIHSVTSDEKWLELLNPTQRQVLDQLNEQQEIFEQQFKNWENDFENWKQANRSHPDINAYNMYVSQWQDWRQRLVDRQQQMKDLRSQTLQQLYAQVKPKIPPSAAPRPPQPPPPPKQTPPPPPPPPAPPNNEHQPYQSKPKQIKNNLSKNDEDFRINPTDQVNGISAIIDLTDEQSEAIIGSEASVRQSSSNADKKDNIEVIEIDCEESKPQEKTEENPDQKVISKVAEDLLFIKKQQELLKSLENLENFKKEDKESKTTAKSEEVEVIESDGFNINEIVSKMKAIKPPEDQNEVNKILSELPALQGIVFKPNPQLSDDRIVSNTNRSFDCSQNEFNDAHSSSVSVQRTQPMLNCFPSDPLQPRFHPANRPVVRHQCPIENRWSGPRRSPQPPIIRKYSAQTIDYSHGRNTNTSAELSPEMHSNYPQKHFSDVFQHEESSDDYFYDRFNPSANERFEPKKKPLSYQKAVPDLPQIEETYDYRDIRFFTQPKSRIVLIDDLLRPPTREFRPANIVIILRGLPGSGKTHFAKLIKEKEMEFAENGPRILSIDDYFMAEVEREVKAPETGKVVKIKEYVYEYESDMESCYRASLLKTYKKTVDDRLYPFIIIDAVNELIADIEDFYSYAIKNDFIVYVIEMISNDPLVCHKNNIHNRKLEDIKQIHNKWQSLPDFMLRLDIRPLLQKESIKEVEMAVEDTECDKSLKRKLQSEEQSPNKYLKSDSFDLEDQSFDGVTQVSRWERMEASESKLDKLDSFRMKSKPTIEEYLQVTDDYELRNRDKQKRVRWADIEEQKKHDRVRQRGFEVGLNWHQYMDPGHPSRALTETKYF